MLAAQPGWAWAPVDRRTQEGDPYDGCQRTFARTMTARAATAGLALKMAIVFGMIGIAVLAFFV